MKSFICTMAALASSAAVWAQSPVLPFQHRCAYDHAVIQREQAFPGYKAAADASFSQAQVLGEWLQRQGQRSQYTVPVAVHVVWKEAAENLPECKILEQIAILNEDYQRLSADTANVRAIFQGIVGNPQIEFRLDTIIWQQTSTVFYSGGLFPDITVTNKVKHSADGGSDALPVDGHLNIWVCNMGTSGVLGYAYPPAGLSNWPANSEAPTPSEEGVVLDYRIVGREGVYSVQGTTLYTQGRAACHEVGHYLGLRHIWGDGTLAIFGIPDCNATDGVNDTPTQGIGSNFACDTTQNTCGAGTAGDLPDMIENLMDYSEETCQNSFSNGQIAVMHGVLTNERAGLALTPAPTNNRPANDAMMNAEAITVNFNTSCASFASANTANATPSQSPCAGAVANDIWYNFTAPAPNLVLALSSLSSADTLRYELLTGSCGNMTSLACGMTTTDTEDLLSLTGLTSAENYYLRFYSTAAMTMDVCIHATEAISTTQNLDWQSNVAVFPNPSSGIFTVQTEGMGAGEGLLQLKNALGQNIGQSLQWNAQDRFFQLDLSNQANGVYWLEMRWNGHSAVRPLVKQ